MEKQISIFKKNKKNRSALYFLKLAFGFPLNNGRLYLSVAKCGRSIWTFVAVVAVCRPQKKSAWGGNKTCPCLRRFQLTKKETFSWSQSRSSGRIQPPRENKFCFLRRNKHTASSWRPVTRERERKMIFFFLLRKEAPTENRKRAKSSPLETRGCCAVIIVVISVWFFLHSFNEPIETSMNNNHN